VSRGAHEHGSLMMCASGRNTGRQDMRASAFWSSYNWREVSDFLQPGDVRLENGRLYTDREELSELVKQEIMMDRMQ